MNNYRKLFEKFFLLLSSFSYPAFLFDANDRIIEMNVPLKRIIKKANTNTDEVDIRKVLKMSGCDKKVNHRFHAEGFYDGYSGGHRRLHNHNPIP